MKPKQSTLDRQAMIAAFQSRTDELSHVEMLGLERLLQMEANRKRQVTFNQVHPGLHAKRQASYMSTKRRNKGAKSIAQIRHERATEICVVLFLLQREPRKLGQEFTTIKARLRKEGLATCVSRIWTLTDKGLAFLTSNGPAI